MIRDESSIVSVLSVISLSDGFAHEPCDTFCANTGNAKTELLKEREEWDATLTNDLIFKIWNSEKVRVFLVCYLRGEHRCVCTGKDEDCHTEEATFYQKMECFFSIFRVGIYCSMIFIT